MRKTIAQVDRQKMSAQISEHLLEVMVSRHSQTIALYAAFREEVDLIFCLKRLQALRHRVVYPRTNKQTHSLTFCQVRSFEDLQAGNFGIYEPIPAGNNLVPPEQIDVICVPGLAFTKSGIRLGYGGGFYDRLFGNGKVRAKRIGIAYSAQTLDSLPELRHDSRMDDLLTEEGCITCGR